MDIKSLVAQEKERVDHSVVTTGGDYEYTPPKVGKTVGRFIEYVELGNRVTYYLGKPKPPAPLVRVTFELLNEKRGDIREIEVEGGKKKVADRITIEMPIKTNDKAKFYKIFKSMAAGRENITHMAEMLGEAFVLNIIHEKDDKDPKKIYAKLYTQESGSQISAPRAEDPIAGTSVDISAHVPPALSPLRIFLWGNPTKECWDTLYIDGTREVKDEKGNVTQESKNWLQEKIISATDFEGSALQQMLAGLGNLPTTGSEPSKTQTQSQPEGTNADAGTQTDATASTQIDEAAQQAAALAAMGL